MASKKETHARVRARQRQLAIMVWKSRHGVTLEDIAQSLEYEVVGSSGHIERVRAFAGNQSDPKVKQATRQQLHRDRRDLAHNGISITYDELSGVYRIDPDDIFVSGLRLTPDESSLLVSLRCAVGQPFGPKGLLSSRPTSSTDGNSEGAVTAAFARAKQRRQAVTFNHRKAGIFKSGRTEVRTVVPLRFVVSGGRSYIVGFDLDRNLVRGFLLSRISGVPNLVEGIENVGDEIVEEAKVWTAELSEDAFATRVVVDLEFGLHQQQLLGQACDVVARDDEKNEASLHIRFASRTAATMWVIAHHLNVKKLQDSKFRSHVRSWLSDTNRPSTAPSTGHVFKSAFDPWSCEDSLALAFAMAAAVVTEGEMTVNQLADKFAVSRDVVLHVFHSLVMARETANENVFFLPFELGDLEDDDDDNFLYIALPESESMFGGPDPLSWTEVFSVQLMLEQISRLAHGSPVAEHASSLAAKIHDATDISMKVIVRDSPFGQLITDALETSILRIQYQSAGRADASWREIVPVEVQIVRGIGYVRAVDPSGEGGYRTYAMDRVWDAEVVAPFTGTLPVDQHSDWLASMLSQGHAVLIEVDEGGLPVFEGLPNVEVAEDATDFGFVLKVIVADQAFLDERLAVAGPHARVIGETTTRSGVEFAKKLARTLK